MNKLRTINISPMLAFLIGNYFALLQFAYYFLFEAFLTSRAISYFISIFFWLVGFLIGLNLKKRLSLKTVLLFSAAAFYISLLINVLVPFNKNVFFITGIFISASGIAPGYFFIYSKEMFTKVKQLFFHENNGFVFGTLISLVLVLFAGRWVLYLGPLTGIMLFFLESFYEYLNLPINNRTDEV